jgi:hypothetical protein
MPVNVRQYEGSPILWTTFSGHFNVDAIYQMSEQTIAVASEINSPIFWRLVDLSQADVTFADVIEMVKRVNPARPGGFADPNIDTVFSPFHPMAKLIAEMLAKPQYGGATLRIFPGYGEALFYIQDEMDRVFGASI